jgi:hypothetical protein
MNRRTVSVRASRQRLISFALVGALLVTSLTSLMTATISPVAQAAPFPNQIGAEVATPEFVDMIELTRPFEAPQGGKVAIDERGWPLADARTVVFDQRPVAAWLGLQNVDDPDRYHQDMRGVYKLLFTGQADLSAGEDGGATRYWSLRVGSAIYRTSVPVTVGQTALLVLKLEFGAEDTISLYVNPTLGSAPTTADAQATTTDFGFRSFSFYGGGGFNQGALDEVRLGASYADVTPCTIVTPTATATPEPTATPESTATATPEPTATTGPTNTPTPIPYTFTGFFQPVDNPPTFNVVNAGRAIPVKWSLGGDYGLDIFATGFPASQRIDCDSSASLDTIEETINAGSSSLSYDTSTGRYTYVWKTDKAWAGTCRRLILAFDDNSMKEANFKFSR